MNFYLKFITEKGKNINLFAISSPFQKKKELSLAATVDKFP